MTNPDTATVTDAPAPRRNPQRTRIAIGASVIVVAIGFLLFKGIGDATMYFRTADEAVAQRDELGTKRFRLEGTVVPGSIRQDGVYTQFAVISKNVTVPARNEGQPVGIFQENIPVVLEGHFSKNSSTFESDRIMVKHTEEYKADYPDRVDGAANR